VEGILHLLPYTIGINMSWNHTEWLKNNFEPRMNFYFGTKTVRTRNKKGRFVKDDPKTMQNEAFKSVKK
jgi:hypothetical protein|tara:strand:- start:214 stop:420 length:207 start_codon:yes stop_codon:yes gene_type:complete